MSTSEVAAYRCLCEDCWAFDAAKTVATILNAVQCDYYYHINRNMLHKPMHHIERARARKKRGTRKRNA